MILVLLPAILLLACMGQALAQGAPHVSVTLGEGRMTRVQGSSALAGDVKPGATSGRASSPLVASRDGRLSLEATGESLQDILAEISRAAGITFQVNQTLPDTPVMISFRDVPVETALKRLLEREFDLVWTYDELPAAGPGQSRLAEVRVLAKGSGGIGGALREEGKASKKLSDKPDEPGDKQRDINKRLEVIAKMSTADPAEVRTPLLGMLNDTAPEIRTAVAEALARVEGPRAIEPLARMLRTDDDANVRQTAAQALGDIESPAAIPALHEALKDPDREVRELAIRSLVNIGGVEAMRAIRRALADEHEEVRDAAAEALEDLRNRD